MLSTRAINIPVLIGDGGMRRVMQKLRVDRSPAMVAVASDELDNIAVSITARALAKGVPVIIRAGTHDVIEETASLFSIGSVVDVEGLTVSAVSDWYAGEHPAYLADVGADIAVISWDGALVTRPKTVGASAPMWIGHRSVTDRMQLDKNANRLRSRAYGATGRRV